MKKRLRKKRHLGEYAPKPPKLLTAYQRIQAERRRQVAAEGWSDAHDDAHHDGALEAAADVYAQRSLAGAADVTVPEGWPWGPQYWKPTPGNWERELVKAGALYEAELDRLSRKEAAILELANDPATIGERLIAGILAHTVTDSPWARVSAKLAAVETRLNELALHRLFPTGATCPLGPDPDQRLVPYINHSSDAARVLRGLAQLGEGWAHYRNVAPEGKYLYLRTEEWPCHTMFEACWQFSQAGRIVRFSVEQQYPPVSFPTHEPRPALTFRRPSM